jgi:PAS domain S-box-containing protein
LTREPLELVHDTLLTEAWQNASVAVAVFDESRAFLAANEKYLDLVGYARDDIRDATAGENILADERGRLAYFDLLIRDRQLRGTTPIQRKDGTVVAVDYLIVETLVYRFPYFMALLWSAETKNP